MKKIQNIQALRGIAVVAVVLCHVMTEERKYGGAETLLPALFKIGHAGVDLFFMVSGFVMVYISQGIFQQKKKALHFLYNRVARVYPTYWVYTALVLIVYAIKPSIVNSGQGNQIDILGSILLYPTEVLPAVMVAWTLIHEMYFYIVYFLILFTSPQKWLPPLLILWSVFVLGVQLFGTIDTPVMHVVFSKQTLEFIIGCFIGIAFLKSGFNQKIPVGKSLIALTILTSLSYGIYHHLTGNIIPHDWWRIILFGGPSIALLYLALNAESQGVIFNSMLIKVGDASYSIYLSHLLTMSAIGRVWKIFAQDSVWDNFLAIPVLFFVPIVVGLLSYQYIEIPLIKLTKKLGTKGKH